MCVNIVLLSYDLGLPGPKYSEPSMHEAVWLLSPLAMEFLFWGRWIKC